MRRVRNNKFSKRALTLVELIVAMALTMLFASACVMLVVPVSRIYLHVNETSRAQLVADTVVDSLRAECARTYISGHNDVWISSSADTAYKISDLAVVADAGPVLVMRRNYDHCETIASCYSLSSGTFSAYNEVYAEELLSLEDGQLPQTGEGGAPASRAIYRMFDPAGDPEHRDANEGFVHFGYFQLDPNVVGRAMPTKYYDFTNPLSFAAYGEYTVSLNFHGLQYTTEANGSVPAFVLCDISVVRNSQVVYTRENVVLCFATATAIPTPSPTPTTAP